MTSRISLAAALLLSAVHLPGPPLQAQAAQQSMFVTVLDDSGAPVETVDALRPGDFAIREDDQVREVLSVTAADQPMQIAIMVDTSQAASPHIGSIRTALEAFVSDLTAGGAKHQLSIVGLGERPTVLAESSSDRDQIMKGVTRVFEQQGSGNYLLDGLIEVSERFKKQGARHPVVVAITTEGPELSSRQYEDVLKALQEAGAALHVITLGPPAKDISEDARNRARVLDNGPAMTGGHRDSLLASSALPGALKRLAAEMKYQYVVTYARPSTLVPPSRITVTATRPGLTARGTPIK